MSTECRPSAASSAAPIDVSPPLNKRHGLKLIDIEPPVNSTTGAA